MIKRLLPMTVLLLFLIFSLPTLAAEQETRPEEQLEELLDLLPEEYASYFLSEQGEVRMPTLERMLALFFSAATSAFEECGGRLGKTLSLTLLCSMFSLFESCMKDSKSKNVLRLCLFLSGFFALGQAVITLFSLAEEHLERLCGILSGILPLYFGIQASMGAISSATVSCTALTMLLSLIGEFSSGLMLPLLKVSFAFDLTALLTENKGLSSFSSSIKKVLHFLISALSAFLLSCFALQNVIAAKSDSAALRAFRFTAGGLVPVVGSALSESSRVLLSGLELIKATGGAIAITVILLTMLSPLLTLFAASISFSLASSLSEALENDLLRALFSLSATLIQHLASLLILCDLSVIFALAITLSQSVQ